MSTSELTLPTPCDPTKFTTSKLDEPTRRAIVAMVAQGATITNTAKYFNLHTNTVSRIWNSVKKLRNASVSTSMEDWRAKLDTGSFTAIERSVGDTQDVHKAASTGLSWLKGVGVLAADSTTTVQVMLNSVSSLPADLAQDYIEIDATPSPSQDSDTLEP